MRSVCFGLSVTASVGSGSSVTVYGGSGLPVTVYGGCGLSASVSEGYGLPATASEASGMSVTVSVGCCLYLVTRKISTYYTLRDEFRSRFSPNRREQTQRKTVAQTTKAVAHTTKTVALETCRRDRSKDALLGGYTLTLLLAARKPASKTAPEGCVLSCILHGNDFWRLPVLRSVCHGFRRLPFASNDFPVWGLHCYRFQRLTSSGRCRLTVCNDDVAHPSCPRRTPHGMSGVVIL